MVVSEAQLTKNLTTRRHGYSAHLLAFGLPDDGRPLVSLIDDLSMPPEPVDEAIRRRLELRRAARPRDGCRKDAGGDRYS